MSGYQIAEVQPGTALFEEFLALPWRLYGDRHRWVPPLRAVVAQELSQANMFFRHGAAQAFVALDGEAVVGRIVASVDEALADRTVGHFGYFEAIEDPGVVKALLAAAADWVAARGRTALHGPVDLSIFHRYRVQTAGFETAPFHGEPRTPAYYAPLLESAGLEPVMRWHSWDLPAGVLGQFVAAMAPRAAVAEASYRIEPFDLADFDAEMATIHPLVVETFQENYGFTAIDLAEFQQRFGDARMVMHPRASNKVFDGEGRLVAYSYAYADPGADFARADGDVTRFGLTASSPDRLFVAHTFGIRAEHRKGGVAELLFKVGLEAMLGEHDLAIGALAKEGPAAYARFGAPSRSYAVLGRGLA
ncbi:MAG: hypothetical protein ACLGIN_14650 [Candidatus Sericytochromatia bacterium]